MGVYGGPFLHDLARPAMAPAAKSFSAPTKMSAKSCPTAAVAEREEEEGVRFVNMGGPPDSYLDKLSGLAGFMAGQVIPLTSWLPGKGVPS
jgi:hypothetical protein